ncbi:MAG: D-beta-D-heptose 7-phosphate kinase / D-beta-D-heptose 1-phosphate adenosyltransferase [Actinoplanes sp.]|jgi:rfaE bifunctional protein nucleotidyltransferase chain/domain/rfaE bifunctional protein kinase chain/domain|nr:D-beta-D-heptose 7-phosphate kinase / D-beta-D-heptose 1-phosphate adenosyltransferase [Actinoplanes sp.]
MDALDHHLTALGDAIGPYRMIAARLADWGAELARHLSRGGRLLIAGNGGSAAEAQHLAAELVGKLRDDRMPLSAIALTVDSSAVTAISNDYGFDEVFARQVRAHGRPGDVLLVLSTSGRSPNLLPAVQAAAGRGMRTWAMTGAGPNPLAEACDEVLRCPSPDSQVVQELHLVSVHVLCEHIDLCLERPRSVTMSKPDLVIVGDTLLDRDVDGTVHRIAPDAPAPVLDEQHVRERPGGAGLAAVLAAADGHDVALVTAIAGDAPGARLSELLTGAGVDVYALPLPGATPERVRLRAGGQVLLRLDRGGEPQAPGDAPAAAVQLLRDAPAILVSDYGRGVARHPALRAALAETAAPVVWDPHPNGPAPVPDARLVTPNLAEVCKLSGDAGGGSTLTVAQRAGHLLRQRWRAGAVAVTCGADGAVLCHSGPTPLAVAAPATADGDTCGAGDRFATAAALALAGGALVSEAVQQAVAAATAYVAAGGVTAALASPEAGTEEMARSERIGSDEAGWVAAAVRARGGTVVATGGCFDLLHIGHLATLRAARKLGDCLIVCLNSDASVRGLKGPDRPLNNETDRSRLLAALDCVDAVVIFDEPTPEAVLSWLRPDVWVKGGDYADGGPDLPEAELVKRWGGQTVIVPYLDGRSTTCTIAAAQAAKVGR